VVPGAEAEPKLCIAQDISYSSPCKHDEVEHSPEVAQGHAITSLDNEVDMFHTPAAVGFDPSKHMPLIAGPEVDVIPVSETPEPPEGVGTGVG